jgi:hypothetical protein
MARKPKSDADDDLDYAFNPREALATQFPGSQEELLRLAAEVAHIPGSKPKGREKKRFATFIKRTNSGGARGQRSRAR